MRYVSVEQSSDDGSRFRTVPVELQESEHRPGQPPVLRSAARPAASYSFLEIPESSEGIELHGAPRRQLGVVLAGRLELTTSDGEVRTFGPGDVMLATDVEGAGHVARAIELPVQLLFVTTPEPG